MTESYTPAPDSTDAYRRAQLANPDAIADVTASLAFDVRDEHELLELLTQAAKVAVRVVQGVDHAGITAAFDDRPFSIAPTDERVLEVDRQQYASNDGPCLRAMRTGRPVLMTLTEVELVWPDLAVAARSAGVHQFAAVPLHAHREAIGSLNMYGDAAGQGMGDDPDTVTVLVDYLEQGLDGYSVYRSRGTVAEALRGAVRSRAIIEQAAGILMARNNTDAPQAHRDLATSANLQALTVLAAAIAVVATQE